MPSLQIAEPIGVLKCQLARGLLGSYFETGIASESEDESWIVEKPSPLSQDPLQLPYLTVEVKQSQ
jgi:hypothetical protein